MTDAEISRRLALAIGWKDVRELHNGYMYVIEEFGRTAKHFDYRDPAVIWPIAERFAMFPGFDSGSERWWAEPLDFKGHDTAAKAVALAVIAAKRIIASHDAYSALCAFASMEHRKREAWSPCDAILIIALLYEVRLEEERHWGPVFRRAAREGVIKRAGLLSRASSNGSVRPGWIGV